MRFVLARDLIAKWKVCQTLIMKMAQWILFGADILLNIVPILYLLYLNLIA